MLNRKLAKAPAFVSFAFVAHLPPHTTPNTNTHISNTPAPYAERKLAKEA